MRLFTIAALAAALATPAVAQTNTFTAVQDGRSNSAGVFQRGDDNLSTAVQSGRRNNFRGTQCTNDRWGVNDMQVGQQGNGRNRASGRQGRC